MISTQYIKLNMVPSGVMPVLYCSQYDVGRPLGVVVYNGSEAVNLDTYTCTIEATRTDGTAITAAVTTSNNIGVFVTTATMTNHADRYPVKLVLFDSQSHRVASLAFMMCITAATMDENAESIEEDASLYQQYTETVQALIAEIHEQLDGDSYQMPYVKGDGSGLAWHSVYVMPQMFGAKGDGVADDTTAILAALAYAESHGLVLYFPSGTYILNQTMQINADGVVIKGESPNLTRIHTSVTAVKSGLDISQSTLHRVSIENIFFNATANNIKIIDFGGFNYSRIENCIIGGTGKDNGCKGISCYGTGINGYYNLFMKNDIGSCDVGYDFKNPIISGVNIREANANLIIGGRIFACNKGYHDTGEANKVFGSTFESNVIDIQVGYGADSDSDKLGGHPIIVGTYHEGGTIGVNAINIANATCRGTIWMPGYFTGYTNAVVNNGTASMLIFPSNAAALRMSMDGFTQIYDLLANVLTIKAKSAYPTITLTPLSGATMLVQNANGLFRVFNSTSNAIAFRSYNTAEGKGVLETDIIRPGAVTTDARPVNGIAVGDMVFDKTLNKPIWRGNGGWIDATGASV